MSHHEANPSAFTPGPIIVHAGEDYVVALGGDHEWTDNPLVNFYGEQAEGNARLFAAAPALVAALQLLKRHTLEHFGNVHHNHGSKDMARALDAADAALALVNAT